jgi:hypothetical protein
MLDLEVCDMKKSTVVRTWLAGVIFLAGGLVLAGVSIGLMLGFGGTFTPSPVGQGAYEFEPTLNGFFWTTVGGIVFGGALAAAGGLVQLAAWIGALVNTSHLDDKTWFGVVLAGGIVGFFVGPLGFAAMLAYVVAGPDGMAENKSRAPLSTQPGVLATTA